MFLARGADDVSDDNADDRKSVAKLQLNIVSARVNFPYPGPRGTLLLFMGMAGYLPTKVDACFASGGTTFGSPRKKLIEKSIAAFRSSPDHRLWSRAQAVWIRSASAFHDRQIWGLDPVGIDGLSSIGVVTGHCETWKDRRGGSVDCHFRRIFPAASYAMAGCLSIDDRRRSIAGAGVLAVEHIGLCRGDSGGFGA